MNAETCAIRQEKLVDRRRLRQHMQTVHKQYVPTIDSIAMNVTLLRKKS